MECALDKTARPHGAPDGDAAALTQISAIRADLAQLRETVWKLSAEVHRLRDDGRVDVLADGTLRRVEAAKFLGMSCSALKSMATRREGPSFHVFRKIAYYKLADLQAWREQQTRLGARHKPRRGDASALPCAPELPL